MESGGATRPPSGGASKQSAVARAVAELARQASEAARGAGSALRHHVQGLADAATRRGMSGVFAPEAPEADRLETAGSGSGERVVGGPGARGSGFGGSGLGGSGLGGTASAGDGTQRPAARDAAEQAPRHAPGVPSAASIGSVVVKAGTGRTMPGASSQPLQGAEGAPPAATHYGRSTAALQSPRTSGISRLA
ncbi:hypothetical protein [Cognatishimia sp. F0-27]|uniref:hypothetical protein n=1 Tax=Cognatishimia sp. F0-27 TaxID=2816855 RepID=UPI001D0BFA8E|nr:hypothetical protein [Cognatishimia sp. F0-27]MCC1491438.1 hypothetical protein [Cognatishimia sp. F0-27]